MNTYIKKSYKPSQNYLVFFVTLSITIFLCKGLYSNRLVEIHGHILQAGMFVAPLWFVVSDLITEIYGYNIAKQTIISGFICQIMFTAATSLLNNLPYPKTWHLYNDFHNVFDILWRANTAIIIGYIIAGFINIRLLAYWKYKLCGKHFWLRSIGSSGISELIYSFLVISIFQYNRLEPRVIVSLILTSFLMKLAYSIILSLPSNLVVHFLNEAEVTGRIKIKA